MYMKRKFLIIGLAMGSLSFAQSIDNTCTATTTKGTNCKIVVKVGNLCHHHGGETVADVTVKSTQCTANKKNTDVRCKVKTKHESGICHHHRN